MLCKNISIINTLDLKLGDGFISGNYIMLHNLHIHCIYSLYIFLIWYDTIIKFCL